MAGVFINYRRDDAPGVAGRLFDHLAKSFARHDLFMDVDAIKPGLDFVKQLDVQVSQCDVLLALIGPHWLDAKDEKGVRRLNGDKDYVRIEIASALKRDIPVIPVLVHGAVMPAEDDLPEDLKPLTRRHALELRHTRFNADADAIGSALKDCLPRPKKRWVWPLVAASICIVGAVGAWLASPYFWRAPTPPVAPAPIADLPKQPAAEAAAPQPATPQPTVDELKRKVDELRRRSDALSGKVSSSPAATPSDSAPDGNPGPKVDTLSVSLGDSFDRVKSAYPTAGDSGSGELAMPLDGIRFFFTQEDRVLREIMLEAPFTGSINGVRIGDASDDVVARLGQPYAVAPVFGGSGYLYRIGGNIVRYDMDKSNKVDALLQILDRK
jgi:hypothetical protein